jgi:putative intracellular protease/amidase
VRVLLPLPDRDFDVTEVAVPWSILRDAGHDVVFATERAGTVPAADPSWRPCARHAAVPRLLATAWRLGRYYRTYPRYVEDEVRAALDLPDEQFRRGPVNMSARGTATDDAPAFVVEDRNYVSARWPGDAYLFGRRFCALLTPGHNP